MKWDEFPKKARLAQAGPQLAIDALKVLLSSWHRHWQRENKFEAPAW